MGAGNTVYTAWLNYGYSTHISGLERQLNDEELSQRFEKYATIIDT